MDSMEEIYKKHGKMIYGYVPQSGGKPYLWADWRNHGAIMGRSENWARVTYYRGKERVVKEAGKI